MIMGITSLHVQATTVGLILLLAVAAQDSAGNHEDVDHNMTHVVTTTLAPAAENPTSELLAKWQLMEDSLKNITGSLVKRIIATVVRSQSNLNISSSCIGQVIKILGGLRNIKPWAFSFFDASGKLIDGMLQGTMSNLGEYDQCLSTVAIDERRGKNKGKVLFRGQYCALDIRPPLPPKRPFYKMNDVLEELKNFSKGGTVVSETAKLAQLFHLMPMRIGICVPTGCTASDISQVVSGVSKSLTISVNRCEVKDEERFTPVVIGILAVISFLILLMIIATTIDVYGYYTKRSFQQLPVQALLSFSFVSNFKKLVNTKSAPGPLNCFNGMRVLSITWIIYGHTYLNVNFLLFRGLKLAMDFSKDFAFQAVVNGTVAVDTFFLMGGTLVCYLSVKLVKQMKRPFNVGLYIFHRIFRIMPIYSICIALMFLSPIIGRGPVWHDTVDSFTDGCFENWWSNLIFINNFYHAENMCLPQSWYLACDIQLYIVALVVLLPLFRWPKVGVAIAGFVILASMIGAGTLTYVMGHPPTMLFIHPDHEQRISMWATSYFKPYSHAGPYFIGMLLGYVLVTRPKLRFSLRTRVIGWCMAIACNMAVLYGVWGWNKGADPSLAETLFYSGCHRVAWALGVAWVVINCATGQGGIVNYILTWKIWTVLGRLTYGAYLIHPMVQIAVMGNLRMKIQPWHFFAVWMYCGHLFVTYSCAFATTMLVEAPFLNLEKLMFRKKMEEVKKDMEKNSRPETNSQTAIENGNPRTPNADDFQPQLSQGKPSADDDKFVCRL